MKTAPRKAAFVLSSTDQGTFIVNRFDHHTLPQGDSIGVGFHLLDACACDPVEVNAEVGLLEMAKTLRGTGVVALDCGANIGVHTVEWARAMTGWGTVTAFEPQERLYYALAGNIALNNCINAHAHLAAVGATCGTVRMPVPDYTRPASFGNLEIRPRPDNEDIGQRIDYSEAATTAVSCLSVDSLRLERLDLLKIDVEGMEGEVLQGAQHTIRRCRSIIVVEALKGESKQTQPWLEAAGYKVFGLGGNLLAVHGTDPLRAQLRPAG